MRELDNGDMAGAARMTAVTDPPHDRRPGMTPGAIVRAVASQPWRRRAAGEALFCLAGTLAGAAGFALVIALLVPGTAASLSVAGTVLGLGVLALLTTRVGRGLGALHRALAARLLGERIAAPPPVRPARGVFGFLRAGLSDGPGWLAVAYLLLKLPVAVLEGYAVFWWGAGVVNLTYPFWWGGFRNHPPDVQLSAVPVLTPFGTFPVDTFPGTVAAFAAGAAMVLAAPWVTRAVVRVDRALVRSLLGPGRLAQRLRDLEETRARAVDDSAALLRRIERDLHDGAQMRLAALALNLGRAREKLGERGDPPDLAQARDLVDAAHHSAKDALVELRDLARGIHPPVLDNGLADALTSLAASSAVPVRLRTEVPLRPTAAIETIAYFCAAELLANAAKHSHASAVEMRVAQRDGVLVLRVADDGVGGADPDRGSGLSGLAQRVRTVDGRLDIASPPGGPTRVTVELPMRA
jgi:signal transduction histidine kinase